MLRHPFTIGAVYEKVGKTSSGAIGKAYKGAQAVPTIAVQVMELNRNAIAAAASEDELQLIRFNMNKKPDMNRIKNAFLTGKEKKRNSSAQLAKIKEVTNLVASQGAAGEDDNIISLSEELFGLVTASENYSTDVYIASATSAGAKSDDIKSAIAKDVADLFNLGKPLQPKMINLEAEKIIPSHTIKESISRESYSTPFMEHYKQLISTTDELDMLYRRSEHYGKIVHLQMNHGTATHYKKGSYISRI